MKSAGFFMPEDRKQKKGGFRNEKPLGFYKIPK